MHNFRKTFYHDYKSFSDFRPHSFTSFPETIKNRAIQNMLIQINLYYLKYQTEPPIDYLVFVLRQDSKPIVEMAIKFLCLHDWCDLVKRKNKIIKYTITDKFKKAFYHGCEGGYE